MSGVPIQKQNSSIEERKKTIQYCIDDIKEKENLAIISHVAQEMWQKEKNIRMLMMFLEDKNS